MLKSLYNQDMQLWIEQTIQCLRSRDFAALDVENLIEELADLGKAEKNVLKSNLKILLAHLIKLQVQYDAPETMKSSWYDSVVEHRQRILDSLNETPSLKNFLQEAIAIAYPDGVKIAIKEGKLAKYGVRIPPANEYPQDCPFTVGQILDEDFYGL
ncbi:DUF29 domain-containing protein [Calothrix sp. 336/3]|uniref:DUF29 domain-containing protein n=1 Tax=Calothrix sp. 336/3 TaxID=1337936 RepID=UPI0004E2AEED|nr:DUF29 domain-containing protein [Calothrix sp. 336/3]AKG22275.1 hypothetical protein IJ00_14290 [Calothrix sp. 336/3]